jgi:dephospho-CoA kinase
MSATVKVIGVIGQNGSGKDEVLKYLRSQYDVPFFSTGEMVREIATNESIEPTRENLGKISERYFREMGKGCFVRLLADKIRQSDLKQVGISGIRSLDDVTILKEIFGRDFVLIRVYISDPHVRYERMTKRGEGRDPHSYEQFLQQDKTEESLFSVEAAEQRADYALSNDGSLDDLYGRIEKLVYGGLLRAR